MLFSDATVLVGSFLPSTGRAVVVNGHRPATAGAVAARAARALS